jgi:hypothetical protein
MTGPCVAAARCRSYDRAHRAPGIAVALPLCEPCIDTAGLAVGKLLFDYDGLADQLGEQHTSAGELVSGTRERPIPLDTGADALMAEIVHTATTWWWALSYVRGGLAGQVVPQHPRLRLQAALQVLMPRLRDLAGLGPVMVRPTGVEDDLTRMDGWQGLLHLEHLHDRAVTAVGLTDPVTSLWGACPECGSDTVTRDAGATEQTALAVRNGDETVYCRARGCGYRATRDAYQEYAGLAAAAARASSTASTTGRTRR